MAELRSLRLIPGAQPLLAGLASFIRLCRISCFAVAAAIAVATAGGCRTPMPPGAATGGLRLGPFFETAHDDGGSRLLAIRPFYSLETSAAPLDGSALPSYRRSPSDGAIRTEHDVLWPLGIRSQRDDHYYWRALLFYGTDTIDDPTSPNDPWRFRLFPFIYAGRTQEGEDYGAFFPFYGTIRDFLVFHEVSFFLFPIYAEGRSPTGTEMRTVLWPFYLTRHGERIDQFRLWPFYGTAERRTLYSTRHSRFVAWPFWNDVSFEGEIEGSGFVLFPIYGHSRYRREKRGVEESWSAIPPLFQYSRGDDGYRKLFAPWPFVRMLDNDGLRERHFWPLWGRTERLDAGRPASPVQNPEPRRSYTRTYLLWPFFSRTETTRAGVRHSILHAPLPFFFRREEARLEEPSQQDETSPSEGARTPEAPTSPTEPPSEGARTPGAHTYTRLWPLFSRREASETYVRVPEFSLWSKSEQVERNWAPLWSLYTYRKKPSGAYCNELLWGLLSWGRNDVGSPILSLLWLPLLK